MRLKLAQLLSAFILILANTVAVADSHLLTGNVDKKRQAAFDARQGQYKVRSKYMCDHKPCYTNRLILENSPYLLQHAHNPIDWFPWANEAIEIAKKENKPVFLSIGYAACHWCHVMEEESFDNKEIAALLNKHFISIKVDREQRPDIDEFYANAVMYFQGVQGWPMSLFLTPDGKAFFGGGYYTHDEFKSLLFRINDKWGNQQASVTKQAEQILDQLQAKRNESIHASQLDSTIRKQAINDILSIHDSYYGGFGEGSKFPREPWLLLLLNDSLSDPESNYSFTALKNTLTHIARGGIHDQLAGGFHRYTTDQFWKVPHFEKMLYTQSLLAYLFLQATIIEPNNEYKSTAEKTLNFMINTLQAPNGGFYSSLDADTPEGEGHYYIWNRDQLRAAMSADESEFVGDLYNIDEYGEMDNGGNILHVSSSLEEFAQSKQLSIKTTEDKLKSINKKLLKARSQRIHPDIDKKIIMSWNSIAINALAKAAMVLNNPVYLDKAAQTADFIWNHMRLNQSFYRVHINNHSEQPAQLDDYAWYLSALINLYDAEDNARWLDRAEIIAEILKSGFLDKNNGGLFQIPADETNTLPVRPKTAFDKTLPSGNAIASQSLIQLARRTGNNEYMDLAENIMSTFAAEAKEIPSAYSGLLIASHEFHKQENKLPLFAARGNIRINAKISPLPDKMYSLDIELRIRNKWHINSSKPLDKQLIPTRILINEASDWKIQSTQYPDEKITTLGFSKQPLALYDGTTIIQAKILKGKTTRNPVVQLNLQACNDQICLPPEQLYFRPVLLQ